MNSGKFYFIISAAVVIFLSLLLIDRPDPSNKDKAKELIFYCAAGIKPPVEEISKEYEREYGVKINLMYGGSGTLLSNIQTTEVGDLYLAADESYMEIAKEKGLVEEVFSIASIEPVIAFRADHPIQLTSLQELYQPNVSIALANPDAASIGKTTEEQLRRSGDWEAISKKAKVFKPTVNDIANDIKIGSVDAGIIWDVVASQYPELKIVRVPELQQGRQQILVGILKNSKNPTSALTFARYLSARDKGMHVFSKHSYNVVKGDKWVEKPEILFFSGSVNRPAIEETLKEFQQREGVLITPKYNGCGILVAEMKAGQRPDAYFACDLSFMHQVGDLFIDSANIAETDIVISVKKGNPKNVQSLQDLANEGMRIGVCNPKQSALGELTHRLLDQVGIEDEVMKNAVSIVPTGDLLVNQIRTGSLDAVLVYRANTIKSLDDIDVIDIEHAAATAVQPFAISKDSDHRHLIERLLSKLRSYQSEEKFVRSGFHWRNEPFEPIAHEAE